MGRMDIMERFAPPDPLSRASELSDIQNLALNVLRVAGEDLKELMSYRFNVKYPEVDKSVLEFFTPGSKEFQFWGSCIRIDVGAEEIRRRFLGTLKVKDENIQKMKLALYIGETKKVAELTEQPDA